ncbi:FadR/GntR family transcriptional regulator [Asticcacaulis taihuensis]|uniref:FadR/GntR family transcriptional regulator n=1 Tax=Asticcacaulis taihuensis TaxID=260084 RepID=UPI003F7C7DE2
MHSPQQPDRLYRRVADQIIAAIQAGVYSKGDKLPAERDLAETYGVSRPSIREAMIALEIMGAVEIRDRSGIYVVSSGEPSVDDHQKLSDLSVGAFELVEARILIEGDAAGLAAECATAEDIENLRAFITDMGSDDAETCEAADRNFHVYIASMTHNGALIAAIELLWDLRKKSPLAAQIMDRAQGGGLEARLVEHANILQAMASHNPVAAREAMRNHLEQVREYLLDATETAEIDALRKRLKLKRQSMIGRTSKLLA